MKQADWKPPRMRELAQQFNFPPHPFPIFPSLTSEPGAFFFFNLSFNPPQIDGLALGRQSVNTWYIKTGGRILLWRHLPEPRRSTTGWREGATGRDDSKEGEDEWASLKQPEAEVASNCDKLNKGQRPFRVAAPVCKIQGAPRCSQLPTASKQNLEASFKLNYIIIYWHMAGQKFGITLWT